MIKLQKKSYIEKIAFYLKVKVYMINIDNSRSVLKEKSI